MRHDLRYSAAVEDDIAEIYQCAVSAIESYLSPYDSERERHFSELYRRICENISLFTVVSLHRKRVAYFCLRPDNNSMLLSDLYVQDDFRRMGIGRMIVQHCISLTEKDIFVKISEQNYAAGRFFIGMGFSPIARDNGFYIHRFRTEW